MTKWIGLLALAALTTGYFLVLRHRLKKLDDEFRRFLRGRRFHA